MSESPVEIAKIELREKAIRQRSALGLGDRSEAAKAAADFFISEINLPEGAVIAAYWPIRDEIDCKPILIHLMDSGRTVCLPVVEGDGAPLDFRVWEPGASLFEAGFGTLAPASDAPRAVPDIVIMPLLGFDAAGTRLGYGRGYYDRTLALMDKKPVLVGYAFAAQELENIPHEFHDVPLDYLVTEDGVRRFAI